MTEQLAFGQSPTRKQVIALVQQVFCTDDPRDRWTRYFATAFYQMTDDDLRKVRVILPNFVEGFEQALTMPLISHRG